MIDPTPAGPLRAGGGIRLLLRVRATVSRVINAVLTVDRRIRAAVERAVTETGYVPNLAAGL